MTEAFATLLLALFDEGCVIQHDTPRSKCDVWDIYRDDGDGEVRFNTQWEERLLVRSYSADQFIVYRPIKDWTLEGVKDHE